MEKILSLLTKFEGYFSGINSAIEKLGAAQDKVATLESQLSERDASILSLTSDLEKAQGEVNAKGSEVKTLTDKLTAAENKANEVLASQGLPPGSLPEGGEPANSSGKSPFQHYSELIQAGKNQEAAKYFQANSAEIYKTR